MVSTVNLYLDKDPEETEPNAKQSNDSEATITKVQGSLKFQNTKTTNMKWQFVSCRATNYADDINHLPDPLKYVVGL